MNETNDAKFEEDVLKSDVPVLVDFYADWCGPCKMQAPIFEETSKEFEGKVKFLKFNVETGGDENPNKFGVRGIPNIILFNKGEVVEQKAGMQTKEMLKEMISKAS